MKKNKKKILASLLLAALTLSVIPTRVSAEVSTSDKYANLAGSLVAENSDDGYEEDGSYSDEDENNNLTPSVAPEEDDDSDEESETYYEDENGNRIPYEEFENGDYEPADPSLDPTKVPDRERDNENHEYKEVIYSNVTTKPAIIEKDDKKDTKKSKTIKIKSIKKASDWDDFMKDKFLFSAGNYNFEVKENCILYIIPKYWGSSYNLKNSKGTKISSGKDNSCSPILKRGKYNIKLNNCYCICYTKLKDFFNFKFTKKKNGLYHIDFPIKENIGSYGSYICDLKNLRSAEVKSDFFVYLNMSNVSNKYNYLFYYISIENKRVECNGLIYKNGKVYDHQKPTVSGVKNNNIYKKSVKVKVSDASGIKKVTLNGKTMSVASFKKGFKIAKNGKYTLKVTDNKNNTKVVTFTLRCK